MGHSSMDPAFHELRPWNEGRLIGAKRALKQQQVAERTDPDDEGVVFGHRYDSPFDALVADTNSGRLKIAASAATLTGEDTEIRWRTVDGRYSVVVPLQRRTEPS